MSREVHVRFCERVEAINWVASALLDLLFVLYFKVSSYWKLFYNPVELINEFF